LFSYIKEITATLRDHARVIIPRILLWRTTLFNICLTSKPFDSS